MSKYRACLKDMFYRLYIWRVTNSSMYRISYKTEGAGWHLYWTKNSLLDLKFVKSYVGIFFLNTHQSSINTQNQVWKFGKTYTCNLDENSIMVNLHCTLSNKNKYYSILLICQFSLCLKRIYSWKHESSKEF